MSLKKMATIFAKEMIEHNLANGASHLDMDYIADQSCDLAYKINEKIKSYDVEDTESKDKSVEKMIKRAVSKALSKTTEDPKPHIQ